MLRLKFLQIILCICIVLISLYVIDKITSENSNDAANIIIGISNIDSNSCLMCQPDGDFFNSGCKRCIQDNINFRAKTAMNQPFISSWSNDYAMLYGDENCSGEIILPALSVESNKQYWTEIHLNNSNYSISLFDNSDYLNPISSVTNSMCSIPTELKFLRFSMNDGKPISNGGRLVGNIDNIEIYDLITSNDSKFSKELELVFKEDFSNCTTKTCGGDWILQNPNLFYIDTENNNFHFDSFISGTNDYAHYELDDTLSSQEWIMRLLLTIDDVEEHLSGKGFLNIDPTYRNILLILPAIFLSLTISIFSFKTKSLSLGIMMSIIGILFLTISFSSLIINNFFDEIILHEKYFNTIVVMIIGIFLTIYGTVKIKLNIKNKLY